MKNRCEALTKKGKQCSFLASITIPNSSKGKKDFDHKHHRDVHLCCIHDKKYPIKLIENGILQHYNKHKYGSIVLDTILEWGEGEEPTNKYDMPEFWRIPE